MKLSGNTASRRRSGFFMKGSATLLGLCLIALSNPMAASASAASTAAPTMKAAPLQDPTFSELETSFEKYVANFGTENAYFDVAKARASNASALVLEMGANFNSIMNSGWGPGQNSAEESGQGSREELGAGSVAAAAGRGWTPVWGNWCGPKAGSGKPVDLLDTACMAHDKCYASRGYFDCLCDKNLRDTIDRTRPRMKLKEKGMAIVIKGVFSSGGCIPH